MERPEGLPSRDARIDGTRGRAAYLLDMYGGAPIRGHYAGLVDTPSEAMQKSLEDSIRRKLELFRKESGRQVRGSEE